MPQSRPRSYVGLLAALIGGGVFLFVYPAVERESHLRSVTDGDESATVEGLRRLCWVRGGVERLDELLPQLPMERRAEVLSAAAGLGCLEQLARPLQATYHLLSEEEVDVAAGFGEDVIAPALELLGSTESQTKQRAVRALAIVRPRLLDAQRARVLEVIPTLHDPAVVHELQAEFGEAPAAVEPTEPAQPVAADTAVAEPNAPERAGTDAKPEERLVPPLSAPRLLGDPSEPEAAEPAEQPPAPPTDNPASDEEPGEPEEDGKARDPKAQAEPDAVDAGNEANPADPPDGGAP